MKRGLLAGFAGLFILLIMGFVCAEKIGISINPISGDAVSFVATIYDDNNNYINAEASYSVQDFYTDIVNEGKVNSGSEISFKLPKNPSQGPWKISVSYKDKTVSEIFNVGDIKRADIRIEGNNLVIENTGNVVYDRKILITIGDQDQAAQVDLNVAQTKKIRLTAPDGEYTVKVNDGTQKQDIVFSGVGLTGNVIGLESASSDSFWKQYPIVSLFLMVLVLVIVVILVLKIRKNSGTSKNKRK
jgi:hypothetical protein